MVCVGCKKFLRPLRNGVTVEEMAPVSPSTACLCNAPSCSCRSFAPERHRLGDDNRCIHCGAEQEWVPYQLWKADVWVCPSCGVEVVGGFGQHPIAEHYQADYERMREVHGPVFVQVPDCGQRHAGPRPVTP